MSQPVNLSQDPSAKAEGAGPEAKEAEKSLRFTPLRSYMTKARALSREARGDLALSPLVPVARLQG